MNSRKVLLFLAPVHGVPVFQSAIQISPDECNSCDFIFQEDEYRDGNGQKEPTYESQRD